MNTTNELETMYDTKLVYWYLDEGGLFGKPKQVISDTPLPYTEEEHALFYYFYGYVPMSTVIRFKKLFNERFPNTQII